MFTRKKSMLFDVRKEDPLLLWTKQVSCPRGNSIKYESHDKSCRASVANIYLVAVVWNSYLNGNSISAGNLAGNYLTRSFLLLLHSCYKHGLSIQKRATKDTKADYIQERHGFFPTYLASLPDVVIVKRMSLLCYIACITLYLGSRTREEKNRRMNHYKVGAEGSLKLDQYVQFTTDVNQEHTRRVVYMD